MTGDEQAGTKLLITKYLFKDNFLFCGGFMPDFCSKVRSFYEQMLTACRCRQHVVGGGEDFVQDRSDRTQGAGVLAMSRDYNPS